MSENHDLIIEEKGRDPQIEGGPEEAMRRLSRRGLIAAGGALLAAYGFYRYLDGASREGGLPWPQRRALETNEIVWSDLFRKGAEVPTFDVSQRTEERTNGDYGLGPRFDPANWSLKVENVYGATGPVVLKLDDIKRLPRQEFTAQFCCIEGWNFVVTWAGARFSDFAAKYLPPTRSGARPDMGKPQELVRYIYMETPDRGYYVGLDMQSALHPQTLLCYEMNGKPLTLEHGAPLRLVIPVKYGVKNLKRIGLIRYTDERPKDFWAEQGYDWFAGL